MGSQSNYIEIENFKIPTKIKNICTSSNFHDHIGLDLCFALKRPSFRGIKDIAKSLNNRDNDMDVLEDDDDFDFDQQDDDDDDDEDDNNVERPMIRLAGPFRYEVDFFLYKREKKRLYKFPFS